MANNVPITPGSGRIIAADDVSGVHYQRVKLVDGSEGSTDDIKGDVANGLDVDVTRSALPTGASTAVNQAMAIDHLGNLVDVFDGLTLIGQIIASVDTGTIYNGFSPLTPQFAVIDASTSGDNTIVAAVSGKKIRVLSLFLIAADDVIVRFESGASGSARTGQMTLAANGGFVLPHNPIGWFETAASALLNLELSGAVSVDGSISYVEV